ncbi:pectinesterase family protein [uncultured Algoriphagus sp.]|uniref:pectinesterase family protein n=1 Tax=uncultured Algoriphagus sp. TaxID=417365 RepID=UPI002595541F|nr:pectinesterase family protein [uncultured Algoriphagus sp.]
MDSKIFLLAVFAATATWATTEPLPVPEIPVHRVEERADAVVSLDRDAKYKTLQAAVDAAPEQSVKPWLIRIEPGRYRWEQTRIPRSKPNIHLVGENSTNTILSFHLNVYETRKDRHIEGREGITLIVDADGFQASNLTIENTSGDHGQALAMRIDGDRATVRNCRLLGWQDTLMVNKGRQYFKDCYIEGRVDFIYGDATAVFENCEIRSKNGGYVTAASTPEDQQFGLVFLNCKLTADPTPWDPEGRPGKETYLGRPWRPYAHVAFIGCELGDHIRPEGWHNWGKPENEKTARYFEYKCTGPGASASGRVPWSRQLTEAEARDYTVKNILRRSDD